jgi:hypothetical protein
MLVLLHPFPYGFLPTTSAGLFRDFLPVPQVCKSISRSALGFSLADASFLGRFAQQTAVVANSLELVFSLMLSSSNPMGEGNAALIRPHVARQRTRLEQVRIGRKRSSNENVG